MLSGAPQGFVLGPVLFLIYINDLDQGIWNWILKFADDTKIFGEVSTSSQHQKLQQDLDSLFYWSQEWQMLFNIEKCTVMHFGRNNRQLNYTLDSRMLQKVHEEKYLGIVVSALKHIKG